jgi:hypothetical protein
MLVAGSKQGFLSKQPRVFQSRNSPRGMKRLVQLVDVTPYPTGVWEAEKWREAAACSSRVQRLENRIPHQFDKIPCRADEKARLRRGTDFVKTKGLFEPPTHVACAQHDA